MPAYTSDVSLTSPQTGRPLSLTLSLTLSHSPTHSHSPTPFLPLALNLTHSPTVSLSRSLANFFLSPVGYVGGVQECRGAFPMKLARHYFLQLMQALAPSSLTPAPTTPPPHSQCALDTREARATPPPLTPTPRARVRRPHTARQPLIAHSHAAPARPVRERERERRERERHEGCVAAGTWVWVGVVGGGGWDADRFTLDMVY